MRYFIGYIVTIGLLIVLILFLVGSGGKHPATTAPKLLNSYAATDAAVRLTLDGPVNADQTHQQIQITVSAFEITLQQLQGYNGMVVSTQTYGNSQNAYYAFLSSLMQASFTKGNSDPKMANDTGLCPLGDRYNFALVQDGKTLQNFWSTTCGGLSTYKGNIDLTLALFKAQIPNYDRLTENVAL